MAQLTKPQRRRHEVRDQDGALVAVVEVIPSLLHGTTKSADTVELSLDTGGSSYRVRIFNPAISARRLAA